MGNFVNIPILATDEDEPDATEVNLAASPICRLLAGVNSDAHEIAAMARFQESERRFTVTLP